MPYWIPATAVAKLRALRGISLRDEIFGGQRIRVVPHHGDWRTTLILHGHSRSYTIPTAKREMPIDGDPAALVLWIGALCCYPSLSSLAYEEAPFYEDTLKLLEYTSTWPVISQLAEAISNALSAAIEATDGCIKLDTL